MDKNHKVLILEDAPADAELMEAALRKGGLSFKSKRVETREDFTEALGSFLPDLILADFSLPQFDGLSALKIAKATLPDAPVIIVSGVMGDERAVATLKEGATDYVLKDKLVQLLPAVERAYRDAEAAELLRQKVRDMELLINSMVGRELKMVELKKEIADLKEKFDAAKKTSP